MTSWFWQEFPNPQTCTDLHTHMQRKGVKGQDYSKMTVNSLCGGDSSEEAGSMHCTSCGGKSSLIFESTVDVHLKKHLQ